jgi:hypothetical protein
MSEALAMAARRHTFIVLSWSEWQEHVIEDRKKTPIIPPAASS